MPILVIEIESVMLIVWRKMEKRDCIVEPLQGSELTAFHYYPDFQVGANHI